MTCLRKWLPTSRPGKNNTLRSCSVPANGRISGASWASIAMSVFSMCRTTKNCTICCPDCHCFLIWIFRSPHCADIRQQSDAASCPAQRSRVVPAVFFALEPVVFPLEPVVFLCIWACRILFACIERDLVFIQCDAQAGALRYLQGVVAVVQWRGQNFIFEQQRAEHFGAPLKPVQRAEQMRLRDGGNGAFQHRAAIQGDIGRLCNADQVTRVLQATWLF